MFNRVRDDENFGEMVPEDIFITCKAESKTGKTGSKNFWIRSTALETMETLEDSVPADHQR